MGDSKAAYDNLLQTAKALQGKNAADQLLNQFIAANQHRREALAPSEHFGEKYESAFKDVPEAAAARLNAPVDLAKTIDAIDFNRGWDPQDLTTIADARFDDIAPLLTGAKDNRLFARRLITLIKFGEKGRTTEEKKVHVQTIAWLKAFAATDPISALRVRRFLPDDSPTPPTPKPLSPASA